MGVSGWHRPKVAVGGLLPSQRVGLDGICQRPDKVNPRPSVDGEQAGVEGNVMGGQAAPLRGSRRSLGPLSFHGLIWPASSMRWPPNIEGFNPQNTH